MARYDRIRGPAANFELTLADQVIPGFTITRYYDDGELLILAHANINNGTAISNFQISLTPLIDGLQPGSRPRLDYLAAGRKGPIAGHWLVPITAGTHTIELVAQGSDNVGDVVQADTAELIVIQLPLWDTPDRIIEV